MSIFIEQQFLLNLFEPDCTFHSEPTFPSNHYSDFCNSIQEADQQLTLFIKNTNKNKKDFDRLIFLNGIKQTEAKMYSNSIKRPQMDEVIEEMLKKNKKKRRKFAENGEIFNDLKEERNHLIRFRKMYILLGFLEKIAIGRSHEIEDLSVQKIVSLIEKYKKLNTIGTHI
ncbi:hypothetical protein M0811_10480 [Anaeramoeba ignava]|uniref:Uncharacterized protein n=1 Tax=Anaeramoeba ignava TaxID=1746090 RepID=A0A9Q0LEG0_ANAIG|nr:hypothetical protein M0811_10480 [Anaeramoeba ignava]